MIGKVRSFGFVGLAGWRCWLCDEAADPNGLSAARAALLRLRTDPEVLHTGRAVAALSARCDQPRLKALATRQRRLASLRRAEDWVGALTYWPF